MMIYFAAVYCLMIAITSISLIIQNFGITGHSYMKKKKNMYWFSKINSIAKTSN